MCMGPEAQIALAIMTGASTAISVKQQNDQRSYQAKQLKADAETAKQAAEINAEKIRERSKRVASAARAAIAASGLNLESETANAINADIIQRGEMDAQLGIDDGADAATRLRASAQALRIESRNATVSGIASIGGTALNTYAGYKNNWYGGQPKAAKV